MAITKMSSVFPLNATEVAYLSKKGDAPTRNKKYPLYIPRLMPMMNLEEPKESRVSTRASSVFKNGSGCSIRAASSMISLNYIELPFDNNKVWRTGNSTIDEVKGTKKVESGVQVTCHTKSNSIEDMTFSND